MKKLAWYYGRLSWYRNPLYEGLIFSVKDKEFIALVMSNKPQCKLDKNAPPGIVGVIFQNKEDLLHVLNRICTVAGWYPAFWFANGKTANCEEGWLKDIKTVPILVSFEPKYDLEIKIPDTLFHVTVPKLVPRILKQGLTPRTQSKLASHPERIYFAFSLQAAQNLGFHLYKGRPFTVLQIDPSSVNRLRLFRDRQFAYDGCYTLTSISRNSITVL